MGLPLILLQLAAGTTTAVAPVVRPTIELHANVRAKSIRIETAGQSRLELHAEPLLDQVLEAEKSVPIPVGKTIKNPRVSLDATVTIDPDAGVQTRIAADAASGEQKQ